MKLSVPVFLLLAVKRVASTGTPDCTSVAHAILEGGPELENKIYDIQGGGAVSPFFGQRVFNVPGIVTLAIPDEGQYIIQDQDGDGDDTTSDAVQFFFNGPPKELTVGDIVVIREGTVVEGVSPFSQLSQPRTAIVTTEASVVVVSSGNALPKPVLIGINGRLPPTESVNEGQKFFESLKAMLVEVEGAVSVGPTIDNTIPVVGDQGRYATGLSSRGTLNVSPRDFQPEVISLIGHADATPAVNVGTSFDAVVGHMFQTVGGTYALFAAEQFGMNMVSTLEPNVATCKTSPFKMSVGSYNIEESQDYATLARHIVYNMGYPDIVALQHADTVDLAALVRNITIAMGSDTYNYIRSTDGTPILYNRWRISQYDTTVSQKGRAYDPVPRHLAVKLKFLPLQEEFDLVNLALTDKTGSAPRMGINQPFETLQNVPAVNAGVDTRLQETNIIRFLIEEDEPFVTDPDKVIVLGSMFENEFVSPLRNLEGTPLKNLIFDIRQVERYSFIDLDGVSQAFDHILVSERFCSHSSAEYIHVNSEFNGGTAFDPMVGCIEMAWKKQ